MLRIGLLGGLSLEIDGEPRPAPRAARARELLAWLALHPGPQPRGELAARFWPDVLDESGRQSLRNALWSLRRDLEPHAALIVSDRDTLALTGDESPATARGQPALAVDSRTLDAALARGDPGVAVELAERGELLRGFEQEWAIAEREDRRDRLGRLLATQIARTTDPADAARWARRRARLDPDSEDAVRDLMRCLGRAGDSAAALAVFDRFSQHLRRELHAVPSAPTRALAAALRAPSYEDHGSHLAETPQTASEIAALDDALAFIGEATELRPEQADLWLLLAHIQALRGHHDEARAASERALALIPVKAAPPARG